jgi:uncharacterized membrane protein YhaH (DUF805 family)
LELSRSRPVNMRTWDCSTIREHCQRRVGLVGTLGLLLFPDGKLPNRHWWPVLAVTIIGLSIFCLGSAFLPWSTGGRPDSGGLAGLALRLTPWELPRYPVDNPVKGPGAVVLVVVGATLMVPAFLGSVAALLVRYRHARGPVRRQLKIVTYAVAGVAVVFVATGVRGVPSLVTTGSLVAIAVSITLAILRHHLFDIDLVINRTVVYGSLTTLLASVYAAGVVGLPAVLRLPGENDLVVAGTTLAVAALFSPLRMRIQVFVDRRFYRARYDARRTVEEFTSRLRDEVDLDTLVGDLQRVVRDTLQPAIVRVWLRPPAGTSGGKRLR